MLTYVVRSCQAADATLGPAPPMNRRRWCCPICLSLSGKRRLPHGAVCQLSINTHTHARAGIWRSTALTEDVGMLDVVTAEKKRGTKCRASHLLLALDSSTLSPPFCSRDKLFTKVQSGANQSLLSDNSFVILTKRLSPSPPIFFPLGCDDF